LNDKGVAESKIVEHAHKNVEKISNKSLSNGSLMRCTPTAVFCHLLTSRADIRKVVTLDVQFTHNNQILKDAEYLYCLAIGTLIKHAQDSDRAEYTIAQI
jgi:ADP-ribosylglycohydrolase